MSTVSCDKRADLAKSLVNAAQAMETAYCLDTDKDSWWPQHELTIYPLRSSDGYGMVVTIIPGVVPPDEEPFVSEIVAKVSLENQRDWTRVYLVHKLLMALKMVGDEAITCERR